GVPVWGSLIPPGLPEPDCAVHAAGLGSQGWRCYLPEMRLELRMEPPENGLPALPRLTDRETARELLEASIRAGAPAYADLRIEACTPKVMRHKPGSRCTVLYRLEYPAGLGAGRPWPEIVVAKTHRGNEGQNAYRARR